MEAFGKFVATVIAVMVTTIFGGFVLSILWGWFMVTKFNLPELGLVDAIGLVLIVGFLTPTPARKMDEDKDILMGLIYSLLLSALYWFIGWFITFFI